MRLPQVLDDLLELVYPRLCICCKQHQAADDHGVCMHCINKLPRTGFHHFKHNTISKIFTGRIPISAATAFLYFEKHGLTQKLLHELKYHKHEAVGLLLGEIAGADLYESKFLSGIDYLLPIPLHEQKQLARGYNQSELIAQGISKSTGIEVRNDVIERKIHTPSQTKKARYARWENVCDIFQIIDYEAIRDKHLLIIDDVITTGSTIESCAQAMMSVSGVRISVFCMAFAP